MREFGKVIEGRIEDAGEWLDVVDPDDGGVAGRVRLSDAADVERAMAHAARMFPAFSRTPVCERADVLERASGLIAARREELAEAIRREAGKPITLARAEADRAAATVRMTAGAVRELKGETRAMDGWAQGKGAFTLTRRFPVGPVAAVTPFNFPLNLALHKIAPALAAGCTVVHKPARKTPLTAHLLAEILAEAGLPAGAYQIAVAAPEAAERLARDGRIRLLTFTGSAEVGWRLKEKGHRKRTVLELGGNAAAIVEPDADLDRAARQIAIGAYAYAGQVCISVQRILVAQSVCEAFKERLIAAVAAHVRTGRTSDPAVLVGPMISDAEADRVESWIGEAVASGAAPLIDARRRGATLSPVLLEGAPPSSKVVACEAFGPVAVLAPYDTFEEAVALANDSVYGLQAGVFTRDIARAFEAFERLEVGGVVINDAPTRRLDHMPYGGVKLSGEGREGPGSALEHMTEERVLLWDAAL